MDNQKNVSATLEKRKAAFEDRCYEAYKFWWSMSHGMSQLELLEKSIRRILVTSVVS